MRFDVLTLFPEMDSSADVAEITTECWDILSVRAEDQMCASSRMVVKHKGQPAPLATHRATANLDELKVALKA